ncbi:MAG: Dabb family protein [Chitinophagaceae bacterium]|nr:MAG: Dabb family protein [Chitinophagaceae bacterium]
MKRKRFIGSALLALATGGAALAQQKSKVVKKNDGLKRGTIVHVVYFWLKDGITASEEADFLRYFELLAKIPLVQTLNYGKPAATPERTVVDHSYTYNLIVTFKNLEDITAYGSHPEHTAGAEKFKKYWKRVEVKDTLML